jgi:predicted membrane channel-forming protein YqfA (hemolysin III family)
VLVLGAGTALLPFLFRDMDAQTRFTLSMVGLAIGAVVLLYLTTQNFRYVSIGLILCLAGYSLEVFGTLKERRGIASATAS